MKRTSSSGIAVVLVLSAAACATTPQLGAEKEAKPTDLETLKTVGGKANGLVVWTSSRAGTPHLFTMRTDGADPKQVTKGSHTDWYPRFSPDGSKILFCRSRDKAFVRESDASKPGTWDLFTINVDGTEPTKLVEDATWGSWAGADEVVFLRGSKVVRTKLGGEEGEKELVDTAEDSFLSGSTVQQPQLSPDAKYLALTLAGSRRQVGLWKVKKKVWTQLGSGTALGWAPDGASVTWVSPTGKELSSIFRMPVENGLPAKDVDVAKLPLLDLPGKRSREAFSKLSNDGKWLVFAASIKGAEHDLEDFELYLWEVGSPVESAARLTFHSANDRWPDVFVGAPGKAAAPSAPAGESEDKSDKSDSGGAEEPKTAPADEADKAGEKPSAKAEKPENADETAGSGDEKSTETADEPAPPFKGKGKPKTKKKRR